MCPCNPSNIVQYYIRWDTAWLEVSPLTTYPPKILLHSITDQEFDPMEEQIFRSHKPFPERRIIRSHGHLGKSFTVQVLLHNICAHIPSVSTDSLYNHLLMRHLFFISRFSMPSPLVLRSANDIPSRQTILLLSLI